MPEDLMRWEAARGTWSPWTWGMWLWVKRSHRLFGRKVCFQMCKLRWGVGWLAFFGSASVLFIISGKDSEEEIHRQRYWRHGNRVTALKWTCFVHCEKPLVLSGLQNPRCPGRSDHYVSTMLSKLLIATALKPICRLPCNLYRRMLPPWHKRMAVPFNCRAVPVPGSGVHLLRAATAELPALWGQTSPSPLLEQPASTLTPRNLQKREHSVTY